jgi:very-short-patch-repair endonuclease
VYSLHEHEIQGLPGIRINDNPPGSDDEVWLSVERLHETTPPGIASAFLRPWAEMTQAPTEEPHLREAVDGASLIAAGTHCSSEKPLEQGKPAINPETTFTLFDYEEEPLIQNQFAAYLATEWHPWAEKEKRRRRTIRIYSQLFELKHKLEGNIVDAQIEMVWGVGLGIWNSNDTTVSYPLVGRLVEVSINPLTAELEIRPRDVDPRIEVDWYASAGNLGVAKFEEAAKDFFKNATITFSPFDRGTFEPLLRTAVTNLDSNGVYWPDEVPAEDRTLPKSADKLKVTDTWVVFARPRTNNVFLQDMEKLRELAEEAESYPPAVAAIITDPDTTNSVVELPVFRGVSVSHQSERDTGEKKPLDLYFPKPFNDEQVRIVQLLGVSDGVVVQGPPGTGKTHTIANVICHYLAEGKRVLVTSMKDPALRVLQEQLPEEIRPLAISLLTSEQDGMKRFEHSIQKIASEVQDLDRDRTARTINHLEESIDALHGKLAGIDHRVADWAKRNLTKVTLENEDIDPLDAAYEVVRRESEYKWFPDSLGIAPEFAPQFSDADIVRLREARRSLGQDIRYLDSPLPEPVEFPDSIALLKVHQDLSQFEKLKQEVDSGVVPALADSTQETIDRAQKLLTHIDHLQHLYDEVAQAHRPWTASMRERLRSSSDDSYLAMLEDLGRDLEVEDRKAFLERPVTVPKGIERDLEMENAVRNLAEGNSALGWKGLFGKSAEKKKLETIYVLGSPPADAESWSHVAKYLASLKRLRGLALRWNELAEKLDIELVPEDRPESGWDAAEAFAIYLKVREVVKVETELLTATSLVFPNWGHARDVPESTQRLAELEKALRHHLTKDRLSSVWATKMHFQKVLDGRTGPVTDDLREFLSKTLGNPQIGDASMQAEWSALMAELSRVLGLGTHLTVVRDVCSNIKISGAPQYASALEQPLESTVDNLLPDNWRVAWRLRRLATHLEAIDAHEEVKRLTKERHEVEDGLSRNYRDVVVKRTWLKLAENASPKIRSALQAYLNAIQKIGKGTGKRAVRYRRDARVAARDANPAVPCWILPHYRVSESLPAELGCFDLVIIDEASQSDLTALPSLLRAKQVLIVGDDKQVSPEGVGLEEAKIKDLMARFLGNQVEIYRQQMSPDSSIYNLFKAVFANSSVMLKEHFRSVDPIIEYSKREFYNHELRPLRVPSASERLDPPLVDVFVQDGYRKGDTNLPEARFIVEEIKKIVENPNMVGRSIGVVSLLADKQAALIYSRLMNEIGTELMTRHRIMCGDARTFQGQERDIMFLTMVAASNDIGAPPVRDTFSHRYNGAASRARDRMYLVRSVNSEELSQADSLRFGLIEHFRVPYAQDENRVEDLRNLCESDFEREMYDELTQRGYWVTPQVGALGYRIDMVVEGHNDTRLAIECDGDKYHGPDQWADDMQRQHVLERTGWVFWRCFASAFYRRRKEMLDDLIKTLADGGIGAIGAEGAPNSVHTERRVVSYATGVLDKDDVVSIEVPESVPVSTDAIQFPFVEHVEARECPIHEGQVFERFQYQTQPARYRHSNGVHPDDADKRWAGKNKWCYEDSKEVVAAKSATSSQPSAEPELSLQDPLREGADEQATAVDGVPFGREQRSFPSASSRDSSLSFSEYLEYSGASGKDPRDAYLVVVAQGIIRIVEFEGPIVTKRAYDIYLRSCGILRMGPELRIEMDHALAHAISKGLLLSENEAIEGDPLYSVIRVNGSPPIRLRSRGPRTFWEIPPSELYVVAMDLSAHHGFKLASNGHLRAILEFFDLKRLTPQVDTALRKIIERGSSYGDEFLNGTP